MARRRAWLFDVDGTLALRAPGGRGPYDWDRVHEDLPNEPVLAVARALLDAGDELVFASGRNVVCHDATTDFITAHLHGRLSREVVKHSLYLRPDTDEWRYARDVDLKRHLFYVLIQPRFNVIAAFDDRNQVVDLWRNVVGIPCLQVSNGNF